MLPGGFASGPPMPAGAGGGWKQRLMQMMGAQNPEQLRRNMAMMGAGMMASGGRGAGFGQAFGQGYMNMMGNAQDLERIAFQQAQEKRRTELMEKRLEQAEKARQEAAEDRRKRAELDTQRWVAGVQADTAREGLRQQREDQRHAERMSAYENRNPTLIREIEGMVRTENPDWPDDKVAQETWNRYQQSRSSMPWFMQGQDPTMTPIPETGGANIFDDVAAELAGGQTAPTQPTQAPAEAKNFIQPAPYVSPQAGVGLTQPPIPGIGGGAGGFASGQVQQGLPGVNIPHGARGFGDYWEALKKIRGMGRGMGGFMTY